MEFNFLAVQKSLQESAVPILTVPWELTTSYRRGTYHGPRAICDASSQLDLFDLELGDISQKGIYFLDTNPDLFELHRLAAPHAMELIKAYDTGGIIGPEHSDKLEAVNRACEEMNSIVYEMAVEQIKTKGIVGLVGGDHSTPFGLIKALSENCEFGILHIDAHADLRHAYQGFAQSHASIMNNVLQLKDKPKKLVQVGIRDFCKEEFDQINSNPIISCYFDQSLKRNLFEGKSWNEQCQEIVSELPDKVYISFDIDGLSPEFCPSTGTPVPGGLSFDQALHLLNTLGRSGKKIVGFDLVEVASSKDQWDGNVGARLVYKMCGWLLKTNS